MWIKQEIVGKAFSILAGMWKAQYYNFLFLLCIALEGDKLTVGRGHPHCSDYSFIHIFALFLLCTQTP